LTFRTFYSLDKLIAQADKKLPDVDIVSMDIFDTLFVRRIHDPDIVKFPVARYIATRAYESNVRTTWQKVLQTRNEIEAEHRRKNGQSNPDFEARYDDFMDETLKTVFGGETPPDLLKDVADYEIDCEDKVIAVRQILLEWIKTLHRQNIRVFLISDIYLPAKYLKRLVKLKGLEPFVEEVISSADSFKAKASGAAFQLVEKKYSLDKSRWLHLGDNPISDGQQAANFGIDAFVLRDIREKQRLGISRSIAYYASRNYFWRGRNVQQIMAPLEADNQERNPLYVDGYNIFGIIFANFIHRLIEQCKERNVSRIYFCSREGWLLQKCWDRMVPGLYPTGGVPEASYLYVSRMALAKAACGSVGLPMVNAHAALLPSESRDFRDICRVFGLDIEPLRPYLESVDLSEQEILDPSPPNERIDRRQQLALLLGDEEFQGEIKRQGKTAKNALVNYLTTEKFFAQDDVALVDIGWLGTIQHFLSDAISTRTNNPRIHGFVLAATRLMPYKNDHSNYTEGLLYDSNRIDVPTSVILYIKDVLEEICRGPHPTLISYNLKSNQAELNFRDDKDLVAEAENQQSQYYAPLHAGILDATTQYANAVNLFNYSAIQLRPWINTVLLNRIAFPKASEISRIKHLTHQDDYAGKYRVPKKIIKQNRTLWDLSLNILRFNPFIRTYYLWQYILRVIRSAS